MKTVSVPSLLKWLDRRLTTANDNYIVCNKAENDADAKFWNGYAYGLIEVMGMLRNYGTPTIPSDIATPKEVEKGQQP